jgi:nicotinate-nucleotide pyrophosphorylase (carboxylating)
VYEKIIETIVELIRKDEGFFDYASYPLKDYQTGAKIILKNQEAIISGVEIVSGVLKTFGIESEFKYKDGEITKKGDIAKLFGNAYNILICERTILNVLSFMSSVATKTRRIVENARKVNQKVKIAATRKTIPFAGELQKIAIMHGGGDTHRLNLSDCAMIKDNHLLLYGSVTEAFQKVREYLSFSKKIEVEVETEEQAFEAAQVGVDIIMLDNFDPQKACALARKLKEKYPQIIIEFSGGVNPNMIENYVCEYIDVISIGKLTTEISYIDYSLEISDV